MVKKRGKSKTRSFSKKPAKKPKDKARVEAGAGSIKPMKDALHELEILAEEKNIEGKVNGIGQKEEEIQKKESQIISEEKKIEKETEKVEKIEKEIRREVGSKPLTNLTLKDVNKGIIGAFIGVVAHFAFIYGKEIAKEISITRATILIAFSYLLIILLMYETGYREIREKKLVGILPLRATVIFMTSIVVILIIFFLFNQVNLADFTGLYKQIAVTSVLASLGAGTADLIGRD